MIALGWRADRALRLIEKARRQLDKVAREGKLTAIPGFTGGPDGGTPTKWFLP